MKLSRKSLGFAVLAALCTSAQANIIILHNYSSAAVLGYGFDFSTNVGGYSVYSSDAGYNPSANAYASAGGYPSWNTYASANGGASNAITVSNSNYLQVDGSINASNAAYAFGTGGYCWSESITYAWIDFTVDTPTQVMLKEFGCAASGWGSYSNGGYLNFDGTYLQTAASDGTHSLIASPGEHTMYFEGFGSATGAYGAPYGNDFRDYSGANTLANFQMTVGQPTPEPTSLGVLALGLVAAARRRRCARSQNRQGRG